MSGLCLAGGLICLVCGRCVGGLTENWNGGSHVTTMGRADAVGDTRLTVVLLSMLLKHAPARAVFPVIGPWFRNICCAWNTYLRGGLF